MIRILIADGVAAHCKRLGEVLRSDPALTIVGEAARVSEAKDAAVQLKPDVILISDRLTGGGGLEATKEIMIEAPTPIVIVSDAPESGEVASAIQALHAGALTILPSPDPSHVAECRRFISTVKAMAQVRVVRRWREASPPSPRHPSPASAERRPALSAAASGPPIRAVAIGASTGGPAALQRVLSELPADFAPSVLIVQHISKGFLGGLMQWLGAACPLAVKIAEDGERLKPSTVYIAPDDRHLGVAGGARILLDDGPPIGGFRPSATFLFDSVAKGLGAASLHVILTGMGRDGVTGLEAAHAAGATIIAQDEASSVIFGMPGAAIQSGVVDRILPLEAIAAEIRSLATLRRTAE